MPRRARSRRRYLAPVALLAVISATTATVAATLRDDGDEPRRAVEQAAPPRDEGARSRRRYWIAREGHTLSEISTRTGVSVQRIEALNPGVDLTMLQLGQRVKVR